MIYIGTTGWDYSFWNKNFYPKNIVKKLPYYAKISAFAELRSTTTQIPSEDKVLRWNSDTPDQFMFISRMLKDVTDTRELDIDEEKIGKFYQAFEPLGNKHQMSILHFHRNFSLGEESLDYMEKLLSTVNQAFSGQVLVDTPHRSWQSSEVRKLLDQHSACLVGQDRRPIPSLMRNKSVHYLRLMGDPYTAPESEFGKNPLDRDDDIRYWAEHLEFIDKKTEAVFVSIDNHFSGDAIGDAFLLSKELQARKVKVKGFQQN